MRYVTPAALVAALAVMSAAPVGAQTRVIHAERVITDPAAAPMGRTTITETDGKIVSIEPGWNAGPAGAEVIELPGKTVMPGLIDTHVHLGFDPGGDWWRDAIDTDEWTAMVNVKNAKKTVEAGFTTVRDVGNDPRASAALVRATREGWFEAPRVLWAGMPLSPIGGHADVHGFRPEVMAVLDKHNANTCTGAVECAALVRRTVREGADWIKIMATGGVLSQGDKSLGQAFTDEEMKSIVDTAHSLGVHVAAHAHADQGVRAATLAGVDTIEHGTFISPETARIMKTHGTVLVPTLLAFKGVSEGLGKGIYTPAVETKIRMTLGHLGEGCRNARAAGVTIAFGTDSGVTAHGRNAEEFGLMEDNCGMGAKEALATATTTAAKVLGMDQQIGKLAPGYSADMVAVDGDPLKDARILQKVEWVMARGQVID